MSFLRLQYTRSDGEIDTYHLKSGRRYNVGRGSVCEVRILDMRLSRKHCAVECINGDWMVADLGSTNGCKIENKRIETSVPVSANTIVTLGSVEIFISSISEHLDDGEELAERKDSADLNEEDTETAKAETQIKPESDDADLNLNSEDEEEESEEIDERKSSVEYNPTTSKIKRDNNPDKNPDTKTVFISALGKKVGPISRVQAKELKKRELQGALTEDELDKIINEAN